MIAFVQQAPNVVQVTGMDTRLLSAAQWRSVLERVTTALQRSMRAHYENEVTAQNRRFRRNSLRWTLWKERHGYSTKRGQYLRRIIKRLRFAKLGSISAVTPAGTAVITFDEHYLRALEPHAFHYATQKVPGNRILTLNVRDIQRAAVIAREAERAANEHQLERLRRRVRGVRRPISISTAAPSRLFSAGVAARRRTLTLAATAWAAAAKASARLQLLGRV
jgi:hypothetical protein